jgi:hypothetical protein
MEEENGREVKPPTYDKKVGRRAKIEGSIQWSLRMEPS